MNQIDKLRLLYVISEYRWIMTTREHHIEKEDLEILFDLLSWTQKGVLRDCAIEYVTYQKLSTAYDMHIKYGKLGRLDTKYYMHCLYAHCVYSILEVYLGLETIESLEQDLSFLI